MAVQRDKRNGQWRYRKVVRLPDGTKVRISGMPSDNTRLAAEDAERAHIRRALEPVLTRKEVPTFAEWFEGRFWDEWVIGNKNKPGEQEQKRSIFERHLRKPFGKLRLDQIGATEVRAFRSQLVKLDLSEKTINNILAVLSKPLRYAVEAEVIAQAPKVGMFRIEAPEFEVLEFEQYARLLQAAAEESPSWYLAVCLAGEAGLRVGEIKALRWKEDVDLVAGTITINQQTRRNVVGTPKGRTRRTVPMTRVLDRAMRRLEQIRTGEVLRDLDGSAKTDRQADCALWRICDRAGLPRRGWHTLRHTFATHAAMFGVNPWRLMRWLGHKRLDVTMVYVNMAEAHARPIPPAILTAGAHQQDPDRRILAMLAARGNSVTTGQVTEEQTGGVSTA